MSDSFKISHELSLPVESVTWVIALLAKRGAGKTYDAGDLAEEMLKHQVPIVVLDGMGTWWGLRVGKDGTGPGLPIVVFGGDHADLPLVPEKAKQIANAIVQANISAVIDISVFSRNVSRRIVTDFLNELYQINRARRCVFIEETDLWAPQKPLGDEAVCLGAVDNFVRRGGNRNLGCVMITQRSAVLNKNILTQSDCLIVLRTLAPQDKKAIQAWVEEATDKDKKELKEWYDSLKELKNGEAWVWHPEKPAIYKRVMFRKRETFHATREFITSPDAGKIKLMDVNEFIEKFRSHFEPKPTPSEKKIEQIVETSSHKTAGLIVAAPKITKVPTVALEERDKQVADQLSKRAQASKPAEESYPIVPSLSDGEVMVKQTLPTLVIQQFKPTLGLTVETLNEPTTPLGRVAVILKNDAEAHGRQDAWTVKRIKTHIHNHEWSEEGVDEAIAQLVRWEILKKQSNNYFRFYPARVRIIDQTQEVQLQ
jgi:hypothetical protein